MIDSVVRTISNEAPAPQAENNWQPNERGAEDTVAVEEPLDSADKTILESMGITDDQNNLPSEEQANLKEIDGYVLDILKRKGVVPTKSTINKELGKLREEMGLDEAADPAVVLDRIGGVIKAWKSLSFIKNPSEKRSLFLKLANSNSSEDMNRIVFEEMNRRAIWR